MQKIILSIEGMTCSACSNGLEKYLRKQTGIINATVNLIMATASIEYEENLTIQDIETFIRNAGFKSLGLASFDNNSKKKSKIPFIVYGLLALLVMYISMSHMKYLFTIEILDMQRHPIIYSLTLFVFTLPFLFYGFDLIKSGISNLIHKMPNMDTLVSLGVISSFSYSLFGVIMIIIGNHFYVHNLYFESTAFVIYFIKLGRYIDHNSKEKTKDAIKGLVTITPKVAKIKDKNGFKEITIDEVKVGDILISQPGDKFAVDGIIVKGKTYVDESFITGESKPVSKKAQDKIVAGSINYNGVVEYKAQKIGINSTISEIVNLVVESTNTKAPISRIADRICSHFVPVVIIIAILTLIGCLLVGIPFSKSLIRFVTVLVVACPCALGLATPLAIIISEGVCAKDGILVKNSATYELANKIDTVVFDKTGTLTNGALTISRIFNYSQFSNNELLMILGSMESSSSHPIAKGIMKYIENEKIKINTNFNIKEMSGYGISAIYERDKYYAGNSKLLSKLKIKNNYQKDEAELSSKGNSIVYIIKNKEILALIGVKDTIRSEAKDVVRALKQMDKRVIMLTGDNEVTAKSVANTLKIDEVIASVIPTEKANIIKKLKKENSKVIMVGDGINDAPSLVLADIGISLSSGTDIASDSSDIILINNKLENIVKFLQVSKRTILNIKQNLFWAFIYNICMIPIAAGLFNKWIMISPMLACLSMIISSLLVILNALRLKKYKN